MKLHARASVVLVLALGGCFSPSDGDSATGAGTEANDTTAADLTTSGSPTGEPETGATTTGSADETGCMHECEVPGATCNGDMLEQCSIGEGGCRTLDVLPCASGCADGACVGEAAELAISIVSAAWVATELRVDYVVANLGAGPSGAFRVDLWHDRPSGFDGPPAVGDVGNIGIAKASLDAGAAEFYTDAIPMAPNGDHVAYAIVDTDQVVTELDENNNVSLGFAWTNTQDTVYTSFGAPSAPIVIPESDFVESTINVQTAAAAPEVWVSLNATHAEVADLQIDLVAPDGQVRTLVIDAPSGANFGGTTFRDGVGTAIVGSAAPFVGEFEPAMPWAAPPPAVGDWTLRVYDLVPGNGGAVNDWSVTIFE